MRHPFPRSNSRAVNESASVSERASVAPYCQLIIAVSAVAAWGLYEEDVENKLRGLKPNRQLLQCPACDRQVVVVFGKARTCRGHGVHRHPEELMIAVGRRDSR